MYPLEEGFNGDYVELIHFLNRINKRYILASNKDKIMCKIRTIFKKNG